MTNLTYQQPFSPVVILAHNQVSCRFRGAGVSECTRMNQDRKLSKTLLESATPPPLEVTCDHSLHFGIQAVDPLHCHIIRCGGTSYCDKILRVCCTTKGSCCTQPAPAIVLWWFAFVGPPSMTPSTSSKVVELFLFFPCDTTMVLPYCLRLAVWVCLKQDKITTARYPCCGIEATLGEQKVFKWRGF